MSRAEIQVITGRPVVLVLAFSRAESLDLTLASILAGLPTEYRLVVVRQVGHDDVAAVVEKYRPFISVLVETDGSEPSTAQNIALNRLVGWRTAFDCLGAPWVVTFEDDVTVSRDTFAFVDFAMRKFGGRRLFRGINLGSQLRLAHTENTFDLVRFGVVGQGSAMPLRAWRALQSPVRLRRLREGHWDAAIEWFSRSGFTVVPNRSRYLDRGCDGSHMNLSTDSAYFEAVEQSFLDQPVEATSDFRFKRVGYLWRADLRPFHVMSTPVFLLIGWMQERRDAPLVAKLFGIARVLRTSILGNPQSRGRAF